MFHSDIVAAMEASPIVTRYPVETSNLKYSPWRSPHGNYRCPKFHDTAFFSTLNDYSFSLSFSLCLTATRARVKKCVWQKSFVALWLCRFFSEHHRESTLSCSRWKTPLDRHRIWGWETLSFCWPIATNTDLTHSPRYKPFSTLVHAVWEPIRAHAGTLNDHAGTAIQI